MGTNEIGGQRTSETGDIDPDPVMSMRPDGSTGPWHNPPEKWGTFTGRARVLSPTVTGPAEPLEGESPVGVFPVVPLEGGHAGQQAAGPHSQHP